MACFGGKKSRVLFARQGRSWTVLTPNCSRKSDDGILQQISMIPKLIYGDYELRNQNFSNKALTTDGGKHGIIAENQGFMTAVICLKSNAMG
jgi:hypothetical protein